MTLAERLTKMELTLEEIKGLLKPSTKLPHDEQALLKAMDDAARGDRWAVARYYESHEVKK